MPELSAIFLDVGQGDSTIVSLPDGGGVLVDCPAGSAPIVVDHLESAQITSLELVVISHSDLDHAGGVVDTIRGFPGQTLKLAFFRTGFGTPTNRPTGNTVFYFRILLNWSVKVANCGSQTQGKRFNSGTLPCRYCIRQKQIA